MIRFGLQLLLVGAFLAGIGDAQVSLVQAEYQKLGPSVGEPNQSFGVAAAVDGGTLAVGAIRSLTPGELFPTGAVYVYTKSGSGWGGETRIDGPQDADIFGRPLALAGDTLVVGDTANDNINGTDAGAAYVYHRSGSTWTQVHKLLDPNRDRGFSASYARSIAMNSSTLVIGAPGATGVSVGSGAAYVYERTGTDWALSETLIPSQAVVSVTFANAVDIDASGDRIVVGARNEPSQTEAVVGAVYVFRRESGGWVQEARITDPEGHQAQFFGTSVGIDGTTLLVGGMGDNEAATAAGAAWFYERSGTNWTLWQKVFAGDAYFGQSLGYRGFLDGDTAVLSAYSINPADKAYHFQRLRGTWTEVAQLIGSDQTGIDGYGESMAYAGGNLAVVGALCTSWNQVKTGGVYLHVLGLPTVPYCTGKLNSQGCMPMVSDTGSPTFTGSDDYVVQATSALPTKPGLFFYGSSGPLAVPFFNATLCVSPPLSRTPVQLSSAGTGCSGSFGFAVTQALMASEGLFPGTTVHGQYWMRDPDHPDGTGVGLSNAIEFSIQQ